MTTENVISLSGYDIDLREVYQRMCDEARPTSDGRVIHDAGLKYLLADMLGLEADSGTPSPPLLAIRPGVVAALRRGRWIADTGRKNNGRYELLQPCRDS